MMSSHRKSLCSACTIGIPPHTAASYAKVTGDTASAAYVNETYEEVLTDGGIRARYKVYYMTKECRVFSMCMYIRMHDTQMGHLYFRETCSNQGLVGSNDMLACCNRASHDVLCVYV